MARAIMVQGTASGAGKSLLVTGLCRILRQDGYHVAPFKSQNMALNSYVTRDGLEMGRAQVAQAEAAGVEPSVLMNPILLKPTGDSTSQVIVLGEVHAVMGAREYFRTRKQMLEHVRSAYVALAAQNDIIVIEGAGSPAEINLKHDDIVNMGMAALADAPVLLAGDIDRGGVFASLFGTVSLLEPDERARVRGFIINKFRGDVELLRPGLAQLEQRTGIPVLGVVPWIHVDIDDEDSLSARLHGTTARRLLDIAVVRLPRVSNFTDFAPLELHPALGVRYVSAPAELGMPDCIILPGTKNTLDDLLWLRQCGLEASLLRAAQAGTPMVGICGGFQMLGQAVHDPHGTEGGGSRRGLGLLPVTTEFASDKTRVQASGTLPMLEGMFAPLSGCAWSGYEIHAGRTMLESGELVCCLARGNVLGTYIHGLFENTEVVKRLAVVLAERKGCALDAAPAQSWAAYKETQYDKLASALRSALDMRAVYGLMGL